MRILVSTKDMTEDQWLEYRKNGIGGSDAAAVSGFNPWRSPIAVWAEKTSIKLQKHVESERMRIGKDLEDYVAKRFSEYTGLQVRRCNSILQHDIYDWMIANVDRLLVGIDEGLECKVTNSYATSDWENDKIPLHYELQCHHYMAVTGYSAWWIAALVGNEKVVIKRIERDEDVISKLTDIESYFWNNYVLSKEMPPPDGSDSTSEILFEMYPNSDPCETVCINNDELIRMLFRRDEISKLIEKLDCEKKTIEQDVKSKMGVAENAVIGTKTVTWKVYESSRIDSERLKKEQPDVYAKYIKKTTNKRFTVK